MAITLRSRGEQARVGDCMRRDIERADIDEPLDRVLERLQGRACPLLAVTEAGRLAGTVDLDNIMELIRIENALRERQNRGPSGPGA